ncbi:MAG: hypothetical protein RLZZ365_1, partial [Pseudomonadota bacterium]|jgi:hypothetical protein
MDMFDKKQMDIEHIHHWFTKIIQKI